MKATLSTIPELAADMAAGRMVILVDDEHRENEGDIVLAADRVTPQAINFMATHARGLICLTMARERCERLRLPLMSSRNGPHLGTAFTVSIEAAQGVTTGISAHDRAQTIRAAVAPDATSDDLVRPGHVFPLQAREGGVLVRAGHTEAGCDLAAIAGLAPASVICEIMNDDGTMARLPDLEAFAARHHIRIGTIADLIAYRSRTEKLVVRECERRIRTAYGEFDCKIYRDSFGGTHLALSCGEWREADNVLVRVHEPTSILDLLAVGRDRHSWSLTAALARLRSTGRGVAVLLNGGGDAAALGAQLLATGEPIATAESSMDLRLHGIGAQILRDLKVGRMTLLASPRRLPSMAGFGIEVLDFIEAPRARPDTQLRVA
ncbi:3,4-dihydroxy-2-butanone-4-phosphate synthase (plasmid) [Cupriavidus necator]|uniref:3,4-dihydroxy-2-butanone 4-phosphate synthase n=1 Tax=Cupriavidus necator TaxID=106590 RepID=A0A1U9V314_CUPNE|nr:bifunctional 3,4-dihydroxy-2-butanone-4-phosphate synthase/GTP cyclohydrolase II [Cupriavidus necator]AQV99293.1 3,4-dihydroxy-2-butanone-4-phosphate synthase [Cupriavidus necator]